MNKEYYVANAAGTGLLSIVLFSALINEHLFFNSTGLDHWAVALVIQAMTTTLLFLLYTKYSAKRLLASKSMTTPSFLIGEEKSFSTVFYSFLLLIIYFVVRAVLVLYWGGFLLHKFAGWDTMTVSILLVLVSGIYAIIGGMRIVQSVQAYQMAAVLFSIVFVLISGINHIKPLSLLKPAAFHIDIASLSPDRLLILSFFSACWFVCSDQMLFQRLKSASACDAMKKSSFASSLWLLLTALLLPLLFLVIRVVFPEISPSQVLVAFTDGPLLSQSVKAILIVGVIAFMMSEFSSIVNSSSALITFELFKKSTTEPDNHHTIFIGRLASIAGVILLILCIPLSAPLAELIQQNLFTLFTLFAPFSTAFIFSLILNCRSNSFIPAYLFSAALAICRSGPGDFLGTTLCSAMSESSFLLFSFAVSSIIIWSGHFYLFYKSRNAINSNMS